MNLDKHYAPIVRAQQDLSTVEQENQSSLPFETVSGPTARTVNSASSVPRSRAEFLARGGIGNTAVEAVNKAEKKKRRKQYESAYMNLLEQGERGADALYEDAVRKYGEEVKEWVPPKTFFYDKKTGAFMPHEYAKKVLVGVQKFKEDKKTREAALAEEQRKQLEYKTVAGNLAVADSPGGAAVGVGMSGIDPKNYKELYNLIPSEKDKAEVEKKKAEAAKARRMGSGGGSVDPNKDPLTMAKKEYTTLLTNMSRVDSRINALNGQLRQAQSDANDELADQLAAEVADLKTERLILQNQEKTARDKISRIARQQDTDLQRAEWNSLKATTVQDAVEKVMKAVKEYRGQQKDKDGSVSESDSGARTTVLDSANEKAILGSNTAGPIGALSGGTLGLAEVIVKKLFGRKKDSGSGETVPPEEQEKTIQEVSAEIMAEYNLDPTLRNEVEQELRTRFIREGLISAPTGGTTDVDPELERVAREQIKRQYGITDPDPKQLQAAMDYIRRKSRGN